MAPEEIDKTTDKNWLKNHRGQVIKTISFLLQDLPLDLNYEVLFMRRNLEEKRRRHVDGVDRIPEVVRHDGDQIVPGAGRVLRRLVKARVFQSHRAELRELRQNRLIAFRELPVLLAPQADNPECAAVPAYQLSYESVLRRVVTRCARIQRLRPSRRPGIP